MRPRPLLWASWSASLVLADATLRTFENVNVQRTIQLGGALTHVTTIYTVRALGELGPNVYTFALSELDEGRISLFDINLKGPANKDPLQVTHHGFNPKSRAYLYTADLPPMAANTTATFVVNSILSHASTPFPAAVKQSESQGFKFETEAFVLTPYPTLSQRIKIRTPTPNVERFSTPKGLLKYSPEKDEAIAGSKSAATINYGPFQNVGPTAGATFQNTEQQILSIHYEYDKPVLSVVKYERAAEISHWGANLNIEDNVMLRNDGPKLKGQFSRLEHLQGRYHKRIGSQTLTAFVLDLPASIHQPYYYDFIGNVSTSRFRPGRQSVPGSKRPSQPGWLELKPRYPIMGGWNYSYTLGWDAPLADSVKYEAKTGQYVLGVPFMTPIPGAAVNDAQVKIILPEGAHVESVHPPFEVDQMYNEVHVTYLDTIGRPAIVFKKSSLTDEHTGMIYVTYTVPLSAHLRKPFAVATAIIGLFTFAMIARRVDARIHVAKPKVA